MLKTIRVVALYVVFFILASFVNTLVLAIATDGTLDDSAGLVLASVLFWFVAPAAGVWWIEKRRSIKQREKEDADRSQNRSEAIKRDKMQLNRAIDQHAPALRRNFRRAVTQNDYGVITRDDRDIAATEFIESVGVRLEAMNIEEVVYYLQAVLDSMDQDSTQSGFDLSQLPMNGLDFEDWVARALSHFGWEASATQGSGDQGVDVIARKDGVSIGIQCKLYTGSVGNKAVQEAFSGARHFGLDRSAVLTNAEFTKSARELAESTGVLLLSPEDIPTLGEMLKRPSGPWVRT